MNSFVVHKNKLSQKLSQVIMHSNFADESSWKKEDTIVNMPPMVTRLTLTADPRDKLSKFALVFSLSHNVEEDMGIFGFDKTN